MHVNTSGQKQSLIYSSTWSIIVSPNSAKSNIGSRTQQMKIHLLSYFTLSRYLSTCQRKCVCSFLQDFWTLALSKV